MAWMRRVDRPAGLAWIAVGVLALLGPAPAAAQNASTVVSASGYANFHAGGVLLTVSGDANGNATAALAWRTGGGSFLPAQPLERIDAIHFAGSLFDLTPGTSYEARVTLADPDGVAGSPVTTAFATRSDTLAEPTLRTLYVSPGGDDGNPGTSPGTPLLTIQRAADLAQAGDLVLIQPGVYRESVSVARSGTAAQPIVFRGNGAGAILDGADAAIAGGTTWTAGAGGTWSRVIVFSDDVGRGHVVRRNTVHGTFNGIAPCGSAAPPSGVTNETDVYENVLYQHTDDGFEPEGYCANLRFWGNRLRDVHMAFAVAPAAPGPLYLVRNVAWRIGKTRTSLQDGYTASALKINSGYPEPVGPLLLYHNTFLTDVPGTDAIALLNPGSSTFIRARNHVIAATRYALYKVNPVAWNDDGDDLYTTDASRLVSWMGTRYDTLGAFRALGQEPNGLSASPQLASPAGGSFEPQPGSPLIDAGVALAGINDAYAGAGPDVGALEWTGPSPGLSFYTVTPCRAVDTRDPQRGGPIPVAAGADRVSTLAGACGIPPTARAVSLNLTVTQPTAQGNVRIYPAGTSLPLVSTVNYAAGQTRANNTIAVLNALGQVAVRCSQPSGTVHVVLDVNGYFE